jgi:phosphoribosyl 1,2-cyclic phosphodiesterase
MSLFITSLNSGSNGNCYYIGNENEAVLIDAGISCKEVESRMKRLGLSINKLKAIFISHEHSDHINGIPLICKRYNLPVYVTQHTLRSCKFLIKRELIQHFTSVMPVQIGSLTITGFPKFHDASEPYSFTVAGNGITVGVFTDIGTPCPQLIHHFAQCNAAIFRIEL